MDAASSMWPYTMGGLPVPESGSLSEVVEVSACVGTWACVVKSFPYGPPQEIHEIRQGHAPVGL